MPLEPQTKLGPYEVLALIGAGGMGEVYKASDKRLNRTVAIKVLPAHFSDDSEMRQRFEREAQTIAALNHPHICTLYDVGQQDGMDFLVMEYLEGETVAERLKRGPLPLEECLRVGVEIADALDKAHAQGVTHRDLKPSNVMLSQSGTRLLDFGLAKLKQVSQRPGAVSDSSVARDVTTPGTILGTMQYMAPEQLEGKEADARTDIFAFGAVLYEMLTGKKAFEGKSRALLISSIMSAEPPSVSKAQPMASPALDYVVRRCLAKDPEQRIQTSLDLMAQLEWIAEGGSEIGIPAPVAAGRRKRNRLAWASLSVAMLLLIATGVPSVLYLRGSAPPEEIRFLVNVPEMPAPEAVSVSPDGRWISYAARDASSTSLFARPRGSTTPQRLAGTEGARSHFWDPNSHSIAFFAGGMLKRVDVAGGPPQIICDAPDMQGGSWNKDGVIVFASGGKLYRVLAAGGQSSMIAGPNESQKDSRLEAPYFLPDGRHYVYLRRSGKPSDGTIVLGELDSKETTQLFTAESNVVYAEPGYLLFHREGTLFAQPFDAKRSKLAGEAIRIADRVPYGATGAGAFAASQNGVLAYRTSPETPTRSDVTTSSMAIQPLAWFDRSGKQVELVGAPGGYAGVNVSPDGKRVAVHRHDTDGGDVWIFEPAHGPMPRLTFDASQDNASPVWSPDGNRIAFGSRRNGKWGLYTKAADGNSKEELLFESDVPKMPMSWSPDGKFFVYWVNDPKTGNDQWVLPLTGDKDKKEFPVLNSQFSELTPQVSPDGKFLAYSSNETGRSEIYIKQFPDGSGKWQVSRNGGVYPRWQRDGKQLFFMSLVSWGNVMEDEIRVTGNSVLPGTPRPVFLSGYVSSVHPGGSFLPYAVSPDGQRFLIPRPETLVNATSAAGFSNLLEVLATVTADRGGAASSVTSSVPITVVLNWTSMLKRP